MEIVPWISFALGILARIILPFLEARYNDPDLPFAKKYLRGPALMVLMVILVLPILVDDIGAIANTYWQGAWLIGWAAADLGRFADKGIQVVRNAR